MFVKFDCGCVGITGLQGGGDRPVIINPCDGDGETSMYRRDMGDKSYTPLDGEAAEALVTALEQLVCDGHRLKEVQSLLRPLRG